MDFDVQKWYDDRLNQTGSTESEEKVLIPTKDFIKNLVELSKKIAKDDFDWLKNFHEPKYAKMVSDEYHQANSKISDSYQKLLNDKKIYPDINSQNGISPKLIHKIGDTHFMTKPYHTADRQHPIAGWGILATNNLYHAGNIGHLVEKVGASSLNKIPTTVHEFSKGYIPSVDIESDGPRAATKVKMPETTKPVLTSFTDDPSLEKPADIKEYNNVANIDPLHAMQIGTMDYLTGNHDRHGYNLLVSQGLNKDNHHSLLAIDHDRAFDYKDLDPNEQYTNSAMRYHLGDNATVSKTEHDEKLSRWWNENKNNVYREMNRNLASIKDDSLRRYVRNNFDNRFENVSSWAKNYQKGDPGFFHSEHRVFPSSEPLQVFDPDQIKHIKDHLPKKPIESLSAMADMMADPEISNLQRTILKNVAYRVVDHINPDEFAKFLAKHADNSDVKKFKNDLLMEMKRNPKQYKEHFKKAVDFNHSLPRESRFLNPFWESHLIDLLGKK